MNYDVFKAINDLTGNGFIDALMKDVAKYLIFVIFLVVAVLCLLRLRDRVLRPVLATAGALVLTFVLGLAEAAAYSEKRPFETHKVHQLLAHSAGQSFPSDHATAAFGFAVAALVFLSRRWGIVLFLGALAIGFARVYDGIHYPLDILGGFVAALVGVGVVALALRATRSRSRAPEPVTSHNG